MRIYIKGKLLFDQPGILLIEYTISIYKWLNKIKEKPIDFIYETMDHYEPILFLIHIKDKLYKIESIWQKNEITTLLPEADIITAFEQYLDNLNNSLKKSFDIELKDFLTQ